MIFWYQSCPDFTGPKRQGKGRAETALIAPVEAATVTAPEQEVPIPPQTATTTTTESKRSRKRKRE